LIHKEDAIAYSTLRKIIREARKYGKLQGRIRGILVGMNRY
jgi:hypothetical protein